MIPPRRAVPWRSTGIENFSSMSADWRQKKIPRCCLSAFKLLTGRRPSEFALLVIGDGPGRKELQRLASAAGVKWIQYCTDPLELARYYRAADLFVHPGIQETFGLVALESQACGTPVVGIRGSRLDGIILHDQDSWARASDPEALAAAIEAVQRPRLNGARARRRGPRSPGIRLAPGFRAAVLHLP